MSEQLEPEWSVKERQDREEKKARESLIAEEFRKRRGGAGRPSTSSSRVSTLFGSKALNHVALS